MTAVIYARYSSDNQREESIEGQIRECTVYAEKNGFTVVKHYIDRAISAKTDNRPQFQQMIKDSDKKLFDIVLVWKLDRFARNRYDSARYKTQLKKNGVKLMSATEIISEGPEGIILESVLEGYAEYYSADLSEKVIRGMTENALKGKFTGGAIPFGYIINADHRFEIDPLTAPFVAETFQPLFTDSFLLAAFMLFGSSAFIIAVDFARPARTAFAKHQCTTVAAEQLGGEQEVILCLSTGRGFLVFQHLFLYIVEKLCGHNGGNRIGNQNITIFQLPDVAAIVHPFSTRS